MAEQKQKQGVLCLVLTLATVLAGCGNLSAYPGEEQPRDKVAIIRGDVKFGGSLPILVTLRKVDDIVVGVRQSKVSVLPGEHVLLVDCEVSENNDITRHVVNVSVLAGETYNLEAVIAPGNRECINVVARRVN